MQVQESEDASHLPHQSFPVYSLLLSIENISLTVMVVLTVSYDERGI